VQVLFLQSHSTCFGRKRPSSGVFKTSTAATGTCVIVAGKSSHLLIRAGTEFTVVIETLLSENKDKCMLNASSLFMIWIY